METFAKKHGNSNYGNKPNAGENRGTTHWSKRKIVSDDNLAKLESLISFRNVNANDEIRTQVTNCECQGACQSNCTGDCKGGCGGSCFAYCQNDCTHGCDGSCKGGCANGCRAHGQNG